MPGVRSAVLGVQGWALLGQTRAALPVGSFPATQLNKVLLFVFEWWLVLGVTAGTALPATTASP